MTICGEVRPSPATGQAATTRHLEVSVGWIRSRLKPDNVNDHRTATNDCPFENPRLRGSGASFYYPAIAGQPSVELQNCAGCANAE